MAFQGNLEFLGRLEESESNDLGTPKPCGNWIEWTFMQLHTRMTSIRHIIYDDDYVWTLIGIMLRS